VDWLAGGDRGEIAVERIYAAAADSVAAHGFDRLNIDDVAARAGCSRATVYRHVGGKGEIRDGVVSRSITRIGTDVQAAVAGLRGSERLVQAILLSLDAVRGDAVASALLSRAPSTRNLNRSLVESPRLAAAAAELTGLGADDPLSSEWTVRVVLSLLFWPLGDRNAEEAIVRRYVAPALSS
jgi:AcrR family transcriptional regulator